MTTPLKASGAESFILAEVAGTTYAVRSDDIAVLEMVGHVTPVPNAAPYVDGVASVRGRVIPVVSLRSRFGFERVAQDLRSRLVVVSAQGRTVGFVVDSAREFAAIPADSIQPPPDGLAELSTQYLLGVAHLGERLVFVLDVSELLRITDDAILVHAEAIP